MSNKVVNIVGGGLAGLMASIRVAEMGYKVKLFSVVPVKRSHSVCAQGGINGAKNTKGEGDSTGEHFDDTVYGGDFLANQPPVKDMCEAAPKIIDLMDRMGVMFNRTPEGLLDFRRFGGTKHHRTAFAGATTGQQLIYALDEQVRRWEVEGAVEKFEHHEMLSPILDDNGVCRGIVTMDLNSMEVHAQPADATIMCTGGCGMVFGRSTNSTICTGSANSAAYQAGAKYGNGEFIQIHPTAIPGEDKLRLMSESARGEGGRVWVPRNGQPWYFLEDMYPAYGNLVPRDIATRAIYKVVFDMKLGVNGDNVVYLDLSHKDPVELQRKLGGILEIYEKFVGDDPKKVPMKIFPAVHYTMGGLWVDYSQMTNIPGLFAAGEADYQYHGANRLGANSLVSSIYGGMVAGPAAVKYMKGLTTPLDKVPSNVFERAAKKEADTNSSWMKKDGKENLVDIWRTMGSWMNENVTVVRYNKKLQETDTKLQELLEKIQNINMNDKTGWANNSLPFARQVNNMLQLGRVITLGALNRNESRGAHFKPDFPERNDKDFLKTTIAQFKNGQPALSYEEVDVSLIKPRPRKYDVDKKN